MVDLYYQKTFSIDEAFGFSSLFLNELWQKNIKFKLLAEQKPNVFENHCSFCNLVCGNSRSSPEWIEAVSFITKLAQETLQDHRISLEEVFLTMVEYCHIFHERWAGTLQFLFDILSAMKNDSQSQRTEWSLFKEVLADFVATSPRDHCHLSWDPVERLPPHDGDVLGSALLDPVSLETAYTIAGEFLMNLGPEIRSGMTSDGNDKESDGAYSSFFHGTCSDRKKSYEWFQSVARVKKIETIEAQRTALFTPQEIFLCTIELCNMLNELYRGWLQYVVDFLEKTKTSPQNYHREWACWKEAIFQVHRGVIQELEWDYWSKEHRVWFPTCYEWTQ